MTEILEVHTERPAFQVLFVPGNPGLSSCYDTQILTSSFQLILCSSPEISEVLLKLHIFKTVVDDNQQALLKLNFLMYSGLTFWLHLKGVVAYYQDYLEALYKHLDGQASVTGTFHSLHWTLMFAQGNLNLCTSQGSCLMFRGLAIWEDLDMTLSLIVYVCRNSKKWYKQVRCVQIWNMNQLVTSMPNFAE